MIGQERIRKKGKTQQKDKEQHSAEKTKMGNE